MKLRECEGRVSRRSTALRSVNGCSPTFASSLIGVYRASGFTLGRAQGIGDDLVLSQRLRT